MIARSFVHSSSVMGLSEIGARRGRAAGRSLARQPVPGQSHARVGQGVHDQEVGPLTGADSPGVDPLLQ